jgi:hypothetical protein
MTAQQSLYWSCWVVQSWNSSRPRSHSMKHSGASWHFYAGVYNVINMSRGLVEMVPNPAMHGHGGVDVVATAAEHRRRWERIGKGFKELSQSQAWQPASRRGSLGCEDRLTRHGRVSGSNLGLLGSERGLSHHDDGIQYCRAKETVHNRH